MAGCEIRNEAWACRNGNVVVCLVAYTSEPCFLGYLGDLTMWIFLGNSHWQSGESVGLQVDRFQFHRLKEHFLIGWNRTKWANFWGSPLFQATYNIKTEKQTIDSTYFVSLGCWRLVKEKGHKSVLDLFSESLQSTLFQISLIRSLGRKFTIKPLPSVLRWWSQCLDWMEHAPLKD